MFGNHQDGMIMAGAWHLDIVAVNLRKIRRTHRFHLAMRKTGIKILHDGPVAVDSLLTAYIYNLVSRRQGWRSVDRTQFGLLQAPYHFKQGAGLSLGIHFKFPEQVVEKCTFTATGGAVKNVNFVLLGAPPHGPCQIDQAIGKQPVCKKGVIGAFDEKFGEIVIDKMDRFGIIGIFISPLADEGGDHVMEHLEHISKHFRRFLCQDRKVFLVWDHR